jgi:uncharacterized protein (DUF488 family)
MTIYTVGHSNLAAGAFLALLRQCGVTAIADVRSAPYSRYNPQFDREALQDSLRAAGIEYVFLGKELGARPDDAACYLRGRVQFDRLAATALFQEGLERVRQGATKFKLSLMCAEKEPLDCHRSILVARHLAETGAEIRHILQNAGQHGGSESQVEMMERLMRQLKLIGDVPNLFLTPADLMEDAYKLQEARIAFDWNTAAVGTSAA